MKRFMVQYFLLSVLSLCAGITAGQTATEIVQKADNIYRGRSNKSQMSMTILRPTWERTVTMKSWNKGDDYSMVYVLSPARDKGQVFLKRENELWNWVPSIARLVKMPPSMMSQGWMGSDVSNDDIMRQSSLVTDYTHSFLPTESKAGLVCYKIELLPKSDADVVWGKIILWIDTKNFLQLQAEYYDEEGFLAHTIVGSDIKQMGGHTVAARLEFIPADEPGNKTVINMQSIEFDVDIPDSFFSQQNMKSVR